MGTGNILLGNNPAMVQHPFQGSGSNAPRHALYAKETGISCGRLGLWLVCAFLPPLSRLIFTYVGA